MHSVNHFEIQISSGDMCLVSSLFFFVFPSISHSCHIFACGMFFLFLHLFYFLFLLLLFIVKCVFFCVCTLCQFVFFFVQWHITHIFIMLIKFNSLKCLLVCQTFCRLMLTNDILWEYILTNTANRFWYHRIQIHINIVLNCYMI